MKSSFNAEYDRKNDIFMGTSTEKLNISNKMGKSEVV